MDERVNIEKLRKAVGETLSVSMDIVLNLGALTADVYKEEANAELTATLSNVGEGIEVRGKIKLPMETVCSRCLTSFSAAPDIAIREIALFNCPPHEKCFIVENDLLISDLIQDILPVELSSYPACTAECLGICPICGKDRNIEPCDCIADQVDSRWEALKKIKWS